MSLKKENIIKDKLLDYEVPFEEKYWDDFKQKLDKDKALPPPVVSSWNKSKILGLAAGLVLVAFLFLKKDSLNNSINNLIADNSSDITEQQNSNTDVNKNNYENNSHNDNSTLVNGDLENNNEENNANVISNEFAEANSNNSNSNYLNKKKDKANKFAFNNTENGSKQNLKENRKSKANKLNNKNSNGISEINLDGSYTNATKISSSNTVGNSTANSGAYFNDAKTGPSGVYTTIPEHKSSGNQLTPIDGASSADQSIYNTNKTFDNLVKAKDIAKREATNLQVPLTAISSYHSDVPDYEKRVSAIENTDAGNEIKWEFAKTQRWEIGAFGGIGLNIPTKYGPIAIEEGQTSKRPNIATGGYFLYSLNKKLSVETGFQYKSIEDNFATRLTTTDNNALVEVTETTIVSRLNSFEIPVGINYHVKDWLHFSGGLTFAYVKPRKVWSETLETNLNGANIEDFYVLAKQPNYGLRKVDARVYAGLTFHVSPFVGFRFVINQGLIDRTKNDYYNTNHYNTHTDYTFSTIIRFNSKVLK